MFPLLVQLGLALAGGIAQKVEGDNQHKKDLDKYGKDFVQGIMNKRASRAGDSMYMQDAIAHHAHMPEAPPSPFPGVVAGMGGALLGYNSGSSGADSATKALQSAVPGGWTNPAVAGDRGGYTAAKGGDVAAPTGHYAGTDWQDDEDKWGSYA